MYAGVSRREVARRTYYRHGGRTKRVADVVRYINALAKKARDIRRT